MKLIRGFDLDTASRTSGERWIFDNKIKLLFMCSENVKVLRHIGRLPEKNGEIRVIEVCRQLARECVYSLTEGAIVKRLADIQTCGESFTIKELHYLKAILMFVAFDVVGDDLERETSSLSALAVKMIYDLENIDFQSIYESVSRVEAVLASDPAGVYERCDGATKTMYRMKLSRTAEKLKTDEYELAQKYLEAAQNSEGKRRHIGYCILKNSKRNLGGAYFLCLDVLPLLVILPITAIAYHENEILAFVASALAYFPLRRLLKLILDDVLARTMPCEILPRLNIRCIPDDAKTLLTYTVSLSGKTNDAHLFDKILIYARAYNDPNLAFSVLADLPDSDAETDPRDSEILEYAEKRIDEIRRYNPACTLFYRKRTYSPSERRFIGKERKRGAQEELVRFLTGGKTDLVLYGNSDLCGVRYILTLDSDTEIMRADLMRLIATAAHPCNTPEFAVAGSAETVIDGYGVFVPAAVVSLKNASKRNKYTLYKTAFEGRGPYESANFSTYTALTGEGVFCGKGLIDVNAYRRVISGRFPSEKILSHDIAEGTFLRAASVSDALIYDSPPGSLISERKRLHRWIRGDVQALCLAKKYVTDSDGTKYKSPLSKCQRALISDSVKEHIASAVRVPAVLAALLSGGALGVMIYALSVSDHLYESAKRAAHWPRVPSRKYASGAPDYRRAATFQSLATLMSAADMTCLTADAIFRAYYRMNVSNRRLLEWTTSSVADAQKNESLACAKALKTSVVLGVLSITLGFAAWDVTTAFFLFDGISWVMYPFFAEHFNSTYVESHEKRHKDAIRSDVTKMWQFFAENVTKEYNFLPPDNVSYFPEKKTAKRTSPTNIGLYLMSVLNAFDFGIIGSDELWRRLTDTLSSVLSLERYRGHLYNWYDTETKCVLPPHYISTVDSGNLAVSLLTVKNGIKRLGPLFAEPIRLIDLLLSEMDLSFLYCKKRNLFRIGYDVTHDSFDPNYYDLYPSEMLTVSFYAVSKGQILAANFSALGRIFSDRGATPSMLSWSGTAFEYFMPSIWLPTDIMTERGEMLASAAEKQKNASARFEGTRIYGMSESAYYDFDEEMNYSYKANGVSSLAISHESSEDCVFSPYSLYLMINTDDDAASVLSDLKSTSLYGKYGFYDALDMTAYRVGDESAVVKQYMAHHIGMSIAAAANYCFDNVNVKRFTDDPDVAAAEHLVYGKNEICRPRANDELHRTPVTMPISAVKNGEITHQGAAVTSNGLVRVFADETGSVTLRSGATLLTRPKDGDVRGLGLMLRADGEIYDCLCGGKGIKRTFSYDGTSITYKCEIIHGEGVIVTEAVFVVDPETASAAVHLKVNGSADRTEVLFYAFPVLNNERDYKSAPAYSDLFLTYETNADSVIFRRRLKTGGEDEMRFDFLSDPDKIITEINPIAVFPLGGDFAKRVFDARVGERKTGAAVHPFVAAVFSGYTGEDAFEMHITHGAENDPKKSFSDIEFKAEKRFRLFCAYAGADENVIAASMRIYSMVSKTERKISVCGKDRTPHYKRDILWRFGISGDLPLVICFPNDVKKSSSEYALHEMLRAKRFLFISGVRFDLVIVVDDAGYMKGDTGAVGALIEKNGLSRLFSKNNGVFVIGKSALSANDLMVITALASGVLGGHDADLTCNFPVKSSENLNRTPVRYVKRGFEFLSDGIKITDGSLPLPWCGMYTNTAFGTLLTNKTAGFSWFRNSSLGTISRRHTDSLMGSSGEKLTLKTDNGSFDLFVCSESVSYLSDSAVYRGTADGRSYEIRVGVDARLPVKLYYVRFDPPTAGGGDSLSLSLYPDCKCVYADGALTLLKDVPTEVTMFSVPSHSHISEEIYADCVKIKSAFSGGEAGFVIAAYPSDLPSSVTEFAKYKYASTEAILSGMREYGKKLTDMLVRRQYQGQEKYLSDMLGESLYQAYLYRMLARTGYYQSGGAYGYRDQLQDSLAALYFSPDLTKRQILRSCRHQYTDGRAQHWWHTGIGGLRSRCSDDYMWLPYVTAEYVLSTGDADILSLTVPYLDSPPLADGEEDRYEAPDHTTERFTVLDHCLRAIASSRKRGSHGLPLMLSGDWNDGMNGVGSKGRGESVWLAFFFAVTYKKFADALRVCGKDEGKSARLDKDAARLISAAEDSWDGAWYKRAYDDEGEPLGSIESNECKIDVIPQAFSVFAGADRERSVIAMQSVMRELYDSERGILRLFAPAFKNKTEYGYITRYPEGIRENGGQYTHAAVWAARAFFELGAYKRGKEILSSVSPSVIYENGAMGGKYNAEPYLICADVYYGEEITGKSGWSGYTGSAAWYYTTAMKCVFGVEFSLGELVLTPRPEYVTGDFTLHFAYNGHSVTVCASYKDDAADSDCDMRFTARCGETVRCGKITKDIKILLKIRN